MSRAERVLWAVLLAVNVATHFVALEDHAASHDESMHAFYSWELASKGQYTHDPMMHGPFLFYATAAVFLLLGASDTTARLLPALAGIGLVPVLWLYRRYLGRAGALLAAGLVTVSPSLLFYGRFLWSDLFLVLAGLLWVYGALRYLDTRATRDLFLVAGAMSVSFCAKETAFLSGLTFGSFFAALCAWRVVRRRERLRESAAGHVAVLMLTMVLPFLVALVHVAVGWNPAEFDAPPARARALALTPAAFAVSALVAYAWSRRAGPLGLRFRTWLSLAGAFWALPLLLFTSLFTRVPRGVTSGIVGSLGYWLGQHGVARGGQPWFYYLMLSVVYEPLALLAALAGCAWALGRLVRGTSGHVVPLLAWWVVSSFVAYSWAGEKMPWLLVHLALPMALLGGWTLSRLWAATSGVRPPHPRGVALVVLPALLAGAAVPLLGLHPFGLGLEAATQAVRVSTQALAVVALGIVAFRAVRHLRPRQAVALLGLGGALVLGAYTFRAALQLSFVNEDLATELLVYAQGTPDIKRTLREIGEVAARTGQGDALEVAYDDDASWPFTWYLRAYPRQRYLGSAPAPPALLAPVVIIGSKNVGVAQPYLERDYARRDYRLIWWPAEDYMSTGPREWWRALADPARRRRLLPYLLARDTGYGLTEWPLRREFKLFVRRDLLAQAWPLGYERLQATAAVAPVQPLARTCAVAGAVTGPYLGRPLSRPEAVAVGPDGRRLIADTGGHRVVVLDRSDAFVRAMGSHCDLGQGAAGGCVDPDGDGPLALGDGQLNEPWGVAAGPDGATLVADTWNGRVVWFDRGGRFVRAHGHLSVDTTPPVSLDVLYGPRGVAFDEARGVIAVADTGHKRILLLGADGAVRAEHGGPGAAAGRFDEPVGVAFGPGGSLHVADAWNRRLQRFDAALAGTGEWPVPGWDSRDAADKPYVAVSRAGFVYASDPAGARVLFYSPEGKLVASLAAAEWRRSPTSRPAGLALDEARRLLLVADPATGTVWSLAIRRSEDPCLPE